MSGRRSWVSRNTFSSDAAAEMICSCDALRTLRDAHTHAPDVADDEQDLVSVVDAAVSRVCGARGHVL